MPKTQNIGQKVIEIAEQFQIPPIIVLTIMKKLLEFEERDATRH